MVRVRVCSSAASPRAVGTVGRSRGSFTRYDQTYYYLTFNAGQCLLHTSASGEARVSIEGDGLETASNVRR